MSKLKSSLYGLQGCRYLPVHPFLCLSIAKMCGTFTEILVFIIYRAHSCNRHAINPSIPQFISEYKLNKLLKLVDNWFQ